MYSNMYFWYVASMDQIKEPNHDVMNLNKEGYKLQVIVYTKKWLKQFQEITIAYAYLLRTPWNLHGCR